MRTYPYAIISNGNMSSNSASSGNLSSSAQRIDYTFGYSVQATYTGTRPQGNLSLAGSNDGVNFSQVSNSQVALDGTTGTTIYNVAFPNYDFVMVNFAATSASSGIMNAIFYSKGG